MQSKDKVGFRREYVPVIICGIILLFLVGALVLLITSNNATNVKIPKIKKVNGIEVKISDFGDGVSNKNDLQSFKTEKLSTNYQTVTGFKNSGILLEYYNIVIDGDDYIVHSNAGSEQTYVAKVTKNGHIAFVTKMTKKVEKKRYYALDINNVISLNDKYYVFINGVVNENASSIDHIVMILDKKGKNESTKVIESDTDRKIENVLLIDNCISIITANDSNININYIDEKLEKVKEPYNMDNDKNSPFKVSNAVYLNSYKNDNQIIILIKRGYPVPEINYKYYVYVNPGETNAKWSPSNIESIIDTETPLEVGEAPEIFDTDYYGSLMSKNKISYYFDSSLKIYEYNDTLYNEIKYGELDTGMYIEPKGLNKEEKNKAVKVKDNLSVVRMFNNNILLLRNTKMYVIDIFDENMNQIKRYQIDADKIDFTDPDAKTEDEKQKVYSSIINIFYKDGKLIFVDAFGEDTSSLLIYTIGG